MIVSTGNLVKSVLKMSGINERLQENLDKRTRIRPAPEGGEGGDTQTTGWWEEAVASL